MSAKVGDALKSVMKTIKHTFSSKDRIDNCKALAAFLGIYLMVGYGAQFVCNFVGFLYPAYASVKAIESRQKEDDTQWLTYWVVYSFFALVEFFADIFLFWIPFYWFLKCVFLVWCMAPIASNGSQMIYHRLIKPIVLKYQNKIDDAIDKAADRLQEVFGIAKQKVGDFAEDIGRGAANDAIRKRMADATKDE
ncbi:receptor expression-enhancing protein 5-like isoform X3 [Mytilus galloprovincialis]|uniref:receptor expression-enhancing protein 5-like isoform X3 n=1 Tax=Mytilus galloprovincialis TaxID=29158 RepID=UPI003F7C0AEA